ncbi:chaperone modulator CbpM [Acidithiobacillus sulfuriphilus]|uniref:MerR family transcriptional regulator n=2 Tax=Acidithiobacillus sulfuriphilus TaxID=1867749 RepID=A0A3M8RK42_9PROT|nr:chaperone modulator CbpM [Acidithiobacillus sulfuriphilus]RNF68693.1 MerR family transcriptional regulator [Acidithiobacillus sulfuriphilus]
MAPTPIPVFEAELLEEGGFSLDFSHFCAVLQCPEGEAVQLVRYGVIHPSGSGPQHWRFRALDLYRARLSRRLIRDLELDLAGAALAVELLERLRQL